MGKKSVGILIGVAAVAAVLGGTGYYFRDDIRQMIPIFDDGSSEDKVYVEKVSRIMNSMQVFPTGITVWWRRRIHTR